MTSSPELIQAELTKQKEDHKSVLQLIQKEFQQGKTVFKAYKSFCKSHGKDLMKYKDFDFWYYRFANGENDLDYDRSKDRKTPEFSDFPIDLVEKVIKKLSWDSKIHLRQVSRQLRSLVDNSEHSFNEISLSLQNQFAKLEIDNIFYQYDRSEGRGYWKQPLKGLAIVLKWPKMSTESLYINIPRGHRISEETEKIFSSLNHQISTKEVRIVCEDEDAVYAVLPYLKPGFLEDIEIIRDQGDDDNQNGMELSGLAGSDQWKQAKNVDVGMSNFSISSFFHLESFCVELESIAFSELVELKNAMLASSKLNFCNIVVKYNGSFIHQIGDEFADPIPIPGTDKSLHIDWEWQEITFEKK